MHTGKKPFFTNTKLKIVTSLINIWDLLFCPPPPPPSVFTPPVTNYMLLYSTLLCTKIARAPGGVKNISSLRWGGQNRIDPIFVSKLKIISIMVEKKCELYLCVPVVYSPLSIPVVDNWSPAN